MSNSIESEESIVKLIRVGYGHSMTNIFALFIIRKCQAN